MRILKLLPLVTLFAAGTLQAQVRNVVDIPDINGYQTLLCDFHMHTVFSDGLVWPTVRVEEAWQQGLDAISLTEHLEYRPFSQDVTAASHGRSYEVAKPSADGRDEILIRGSEITRGMPPGHFNAIFLEDCDALAKDDWRDSFAEAKKQNAFIFWNHPSWSAQQPDTTLWFPEHTEIYDNGWMQGIEVVNGGGYSEEAFQWAIDKKLTMLGSSDAHNPLHYSPGDHRSLTLVFAKERTPEAIREALDNRRTAVYFGTTLVGEAQYLRAIFESSLEILHTYRSEAGISVILQNNSGLTFRLKKTAHDTDIVYFRDYTIRPHGQHTITVKFPAGKEGNVNFEITNLLVKPGKGLDLSYSITDF